MYTIVLYTYIVNTYSWLFHSNFYIYIYIYNIYIYIYIYIHVYILEIMQLIMNTCYDIFSRVLS